MKTRIFLTIACCVLLVTSSAARVFGGVMLADLFDTATPPCVETKDSGEKVDNGVIVTFTGVIVTFSDDRGGDADCGIILSD